MQKKRYEVLGGGLPRPAISTQLLVDGFYPMGSYPFPDDQQNIRWMNIRKALDLAVIYHMGYPTPPIVEQRINQGFDIALDYFCGDWWKTDVQRELLDKASPTFNDNYWLSPFNDGLLLGMLADRWKDVGKICSWMEARLVMPHDPGITAMLASIAAKLRTEPMAGLDIAEAHMLAGKVKRDVPTINSWMAVKAGDQVGFDKEMKAALKHGLKDYKRANFIGDYVAQIESIIVSSAMHLGMQFPRDLPEELAALIITRETLDLGQPTV